MDDTRKLNGSTAILEPIHPEIISITPASGAWVVRTVGTHGVDQRYLRSLVLVWALVRYPGPPSFTEVVPLVEGDTGLTFVDHSARWLWFESAGGRCTCRPYSPPSWQTDDPWWCTTCASRIERVEHE